MVVPDLYVFTLKFHSNFSLYKKDKNMKKKIPKINKYIFYLYFMQLFSADARLFSKKNGPQKLLIIGPDPFISQSSPDQRPTAQN